MVAQVFSFLIGILLVQQLRALPSAAWLPLAVLTLVFLAGFKYWRSFFCVAGVLWAVIHATDRLNDRLPAALTGQDIEIQGYLSDLPEEGDHNIRFNFTATKSRHPVPKKIRLTWYYPTQRLMTGQAWTMTVRLKPPHGSFNPGGFDFERWLFTEEIGATGYVRPQPAPKCSNPAIAGANLLVWRQNIANRIDQLPINPTSLAIIKALTIGDGNSLIPQQWDVFRQTGTTHLMVISGSHIGLIAGLAYLVILKCWAWTGFLRWPPQKVAGLIALLIGIFYAALTGFSVPAQRAALMISVAMLAIIQQRNTRPYTVLAIALAVILLFDPLVVLSAGFWLSFIAVGLIIYVLAGRLGKLGTLKSGVLINGVTAVGLAPLLLYFFQQVSLIAPVANLIAVPVISIAVVPLALLATLMLFVVPSVSQALFSVVDLILQSLWSLLVKLADIPLASIYHTPPPAWALGFAVPGLLLLLAPKGMPARSLGLILLFPLVFTHSNKIASGAIQMTLLDVGQGLAAVVQTANHVLVYDTGARFSSTQDSGQSVLIPFLRHQGISTIDNLVVSHGDNDHVGGVDSLLANMPTHQFLTSVPAQFTHYSAVQCTAGQSWVWDEVTFTLLSPQPNRFSSDNDQSCVLQIREKRGSVLLTGDIESNAESWLSSTYGNQLKVDVLIAPHHGSQTSSSAPFLKAVAPKAILIPAGFHNQFGHPHADVIRRYQSLNIPWFNTSIDGALQVSFENKLIINSWRAAEGQYWNFTSSDR